MGMPKEKNHGDTENMKKGRKKRKRRKENLHRKGAKKR